MSIIEETAKNLEKLGLTSYQAKTYVALVALGRAASAPEISQTSGVPKSRIYDILEELASAQINLIFKVPTSDPRRFKYQAKPPGIALDQYIDPVKEQAKQELSQLFLNQGQGNLEPPRVYQTQASVQDLLEQDIVLVVSPNGRVTKQLRALFTRHGKAVPVLSGKDPEGNAVQVLTSSSMIVFRLRTPPLMLTVIEDTELLRAYKKQLSVMGMFLAEVPVIAGVISVLLTGSGLFERNKLTHPHVVLFSLEHLQVFLEGQLELNIPLSNISSFSVKPISSWVNQVSVDITGTGGKELGELMFHVVGDDQYLGVLFRNVLEGRIDGQ